MQARYFDPVIGRFLSTDPIGYRDQMNLYAYVHNDPVNATDPTGMATCTGSKMNNKTSCDTTNGGSSGLNLSYQEKQMVRRARESHNADNSQATLVAGPGGVKPNTVVVERDILQACKADNHCAAPFENLEISTSSKGFALGQVSVMFSVKSHSGRVEINVAPKNSMDPVDVILLARGSSSKFVTRRFGKGAAKGAAKTAGFNGIEVSIRNNRRTILQRSVAPGTRLLIDVPDHSSLIFNVRMSDMFATQGTILVEGAYDYVPY